jgi:hypothetical protein
MFSLTIHKRRLRALNHSRSDLAAYFGLGALAALNLALRWWP